MILSLLAGASGGIIGIALGHYFYKWIESHEWRGWFLDG